MSRKRLILGPLKNLVTGENSQFSTTEKDNLLDCVNFIPESSGALRSRPGIKKTLPLNILKNDRALFFSFKGKDYAVIYDTLLKCDYFYDDRIKFQLREPQFSPFSDGIIGGDDEDDINVIIGVRGTTRPVFGNTDFFTKINFETQDSIFYNNYRMNLRGPLRVYDTILPYAKGPIKGDAGNRNHVMPGFDSPNWAARQGFADGGYTADTSNELGEFLEGMRACVYDLNSSMWWQRMFLYNITDDSIETYKILRPSKTLEDSGHTNLNPFSRETNRGDATYPKSSIGAGGYGSLPGTSSIEMRNYIEASEENREAYFGGSDLEYDIAIGPNEIILTDKTGTLPTMYLDMNKKEAFMDLRCKYFSKQFPGLANSEGIEDTDEVEYLQEVCLFNSYLSEEEFNKRDNDVNKLAEFSPKFKYIENYENPKSSPYTFFDTYNSIFTENPSKFISDNGTAANFNPFYNSGTSPFENTLPERANFIVSRPLDVPFFERITSEYVANTPSSVEQGRRAISFCKVRSVNGEPWYEVKQYRSLGSSEHNTFFFGFSDPYIFASRSLTNSIRDGALQSSSSSLNRLFPQWLFPQFKLYKVNTRPNVKGYSLEYMAVSRFSPHDRREGLNGADFEFLLPAGIEYVVPISSSSVPGESDQNEYVTSTFPHTGNTVININYIEKKTIAMVGGYQGGYFDSAAFFNAKLVLSNSALEFENSFIASKSVDQLEFSGIRRGRTNDGTETLLLEGFIQVLTPAGGLRIFRVDTVDNSLYLATNKGEIVTDELTPGGLDTFNISGVAVSDIPRRTVYGMTFVVPPDKQDIYLLETLRDFSRVQYTSMLRYLRQDFLRGRRVDHFVTSPLEGNAMFLIDGRLYFVYITDDQKFIFSRLDFNKERVFSIGYFENGDALVQTAERIIIFNPFGDEDLEDDAELSFTFMHPSQYKRAIERNEAVQPTASLDVENLNEIRLFGELGDEIAQGSNLEGIKSRHRVHNAYAQFNGSSLKTVKDGLKIQFSSRKVVISSMEFTL